MKHVVAADGDVVAAVLGSKVTAGADGYGQVAQQLDAGKVRALAIPSPARLPGVNVFRLHQE
jgi:putative tricarboxylic transport membrane protein